MSIWAKIRIVLLFVFFIQGLLGAVLDLDNVLASQHLIVQISFVVVPIFFLPLGLLLIIGIQYVNPLQNRQWTVPSMNSNFLSLKDPLHFFHASAYFLATAGLGVVVGSLFKDLSNATMGLGLLSGSLGLFLGVKLCVKAYDKKFGEMERSPNRGLVEGSVVDRTAKVIGTLMVLAAVVAILVGTLCLIKTRQFLAKAAKADGKIVELERKDSGDGVTYSPVFSFTDTSSTQHTVRSSLSSNPPHYAIEEKVSVLYDPQDPQKARIDSFVNLYFVPLVMGIIGAMNLLVGLLLVFVVPVFTRGIKGNS
jgi:hypothetical protein